MSSSQHKWIRRPSTVAMMLISFSLLLLVHAGLHEADSPPEYPAIQAGLPMSNGAMPIADGTLPTGVEQDWWTTVQANISASEYEFHKTEGDLLAPNRRQDLRVRISTAGIHLEPRLAEGRTWEWSWRTTAWGRVDASRSVLEVAPAGDATLAEYERDGLVEWYENTPEGLEQGFTIAASPAGAGRLCIEGDFAGDLTARLDGDQAIEFLTDEGALAMRYDKLLAWDAEGSELASEMVLTDNTIRLLVDDSEAIYPIVIDPLMSTPDWEWSTDEASSYGGCAVATAGDVNGDGYSDVLVGAYMLSNYVANAGAVFCFHGGPDGLSADPDWVKRGGYVNAFFGKSLSTAGDVNGDGYDDVIIGEENIPTDTGTGKVHIYLGSGDGLESLPFWELESDVLYSYLGWSVSYAGDVNADGFDDVIFSERSWGEEWPDINFGRVHVYGGGADTMHWLATRTGGCANAFAGLYVSGAGDIDADGYDDVAYCEAENCPSEEIRILYGDVSGAMTRDDLLHEGGGGLFGNPVAAAGDVNGDGYADLIVGAPLAYTGEDYGEGWVYCYHGGAGGIDPTAAWIKEGGQPGAYFGSSVATAGDLNGDGYADVIIGADHWTNGESEEGRAFVYLGSASGLATEYVWAKDSDQVEAEFGSSVATAGDVNGDGFSDIIVGADHYDQDGYTDCGRAFVFHGGAYGPKETSGWYAVSGQENARGGFSLAGGGDVNGDGYSDVLVSAPWYDLGETDEGVVWLFMGGATGLLYTPAWYAEGNQNDAHFGFAVDFAGDVNGDGLDDVIIGASQYNTGASYAGAAFVWFSQVGGIPTGNPDNADWAYYCDQSGARFGLSACGAGDVNGDGYSDIVVGAPYYDNGQSNEGAVFGFHGSATGPSAEYDWFHDTGSVDSGFGMRLDGVGDVNGDGYSDLIVGASYYDHYLEDEGMAVIYIGSEDGLQTGAPWWYGESNQAGAQFGLSVSTAGDVNGDGYSDWMVSAPYYEFTLEHQGGVFIWHGGPTPPASGTPDNADFACSYLQAYAHAGMSASTAGDINGDGFSDILVGVPGCDAGYGIGAGCAYIFYGSEDGVGGSGSSYWLVFGNQAYASFGSQVDCAGDVNGDGFSDVLVAAKYYTWTVNEEGGTWLFYGNGGRSILRRPQQMQPDFSGQVAALGRSNAENEIGLSMYGRSAAGRTRVKGVYEVKPHDTPFDGSATFIDPDWQQLGAPDAWGTWNELSAVVGGLFEDSAYKWRMRAKSSNPLFPTTIWLSIPNNERTHWNFRTADGGVGVEDGPMAGPFALSNYPNPFNPETTILFNLPKRAQTRLDIHDVQGRRIATLVDGMQEAGRMQVVWTGRDDDGRALPSGVYFARLSTGERVDSRKLVLVK